MKRRSLLQSLAALPAAGLLRAQQVIPPKPSPTAIEEIPVIEATVPDFAAETVPHFFSADQYTALEHLSELIYPELDGVPGARTANAAAFLDFLLGQSPAPRQKLYREGLDQLNSRAKQRFQKTFAEASASEAGALLAPLGQPWTFEEPDTYAAFLRAAKDDVFEATRNSHQWSDAMSSRDRRAAGVGYYWFPIE